MSVTLSRELAPSAPRRLGEVIVADEQAANRLLIRKTLSCDGYRVREAANLDDVIDLLLAEGAPAPQVIDAEGLTFSAQLILASADLHGLLPLRAVNCDLADVPLVLMADRINNKTRAAARLLSASALIHRPVYIDEVRRVVREIFSTPRSEWTLPHAA
ncbi:MAG: hypothetical protein H6707_16810 [Deltaproteobacteria bacterium]|nr:hypothetical protein [Deltaproteobacteria bacterium]